MIEIKDLTKSFDENKIFNSFSLAIKDGEFVVITGVSGCGKTTLLNMIGGIEPVDSGTIVVNGYDINKKINKRKYYINQVGFLFQNFALVERKTVLQNLEMVQKKARTTLTVEEVLKKADIVGKEKNKVYQLSGGEQQRVALARLMLKKCNVILADEPTGALDRHNSQRVMELLKELNKQGKTIVMVTHDESLIDDSMVRINIS